MVLLPGGLHALKDAGFLHGVELFGGVVLLVEVSVGLFPGLRHSVLGGETEDMSHIVHNLNQKLKREMVVMRQNV